MGVQGGSPWSGSGGEPPVFFCLLSFSSFGLVSSFSVFFSFLLFHHLKGLQAMTKRHYDQLQAASTLLCRALHELYLVRCEGSLRLEFNEYLDEAIEQCRLSDDSILKVTTRFSSFFNSESYSDKAFQS